MERSTHTHTHLISSLVCFPAEADPLGIMLKCFGYMRAVDAVLCFTTAH